MTENVKYLFTNETHDGALVMRSTVNSFGLDHTTDKDLYSFYTEFSQRAYFDSGLLPVAGTGLLSIRSALEHTQIAYQYAPGTYYVNWGRYERDASAKKYLLAQPYRIVIIDFLNGNIYGARTFYSPIPVTHPNVPLYHTNLPNINCRGYRGNGVGWICLYHTEDLTSFPFNEKLVKALERCSGVEAYNDGNMSETDGTRFYQEFRPQHNFLWNPEQWEEKTSRDGWEWTLDEELWIPVLVTDLDHQDKHDHDGQPLLFVDALFGDYQAYYSDTLIPKPINAISRRDKELDRDKLFAHFKQSYLKSQSSDTPFDHINTFSLSSAIKATIAVAPVVDPNLYEDEEEEYEPEYVTVNCEKCGYEEVFEDGGDPDELMWLHNLGMWICPDCFAGNFVVQNKGISQYHHVDSPEGQQIIHEFRSEHSFCLHPDLHGDNEIKSMSFIHKGFNNKSLNAALDDIQSSSQMAHMFSFNNHLSVFFDINVVNISDLDTFITNWSDKNNGFIAPYVKLWSQNPALLHNATAHVAFPQMCYECAVRYLQDFDSFVQMTDIISSIVVDGLSNIQNFDDFSGDLKNLVIELIMAPNTHLHYRT